MSVLEFFIRYWSMILGAITATMGIIAKINSYSDKKNKTLIAINQINTRISEQNKVLESIKSDRVEDKSQLQDLSGSMKVVLAFISKKDTD